MALRTHNLTFLHDFHEEIPLPDYQAGDEVVAQYSRALRNDWVGKQVYLRATVEKDGNLTAEDMKKAREETIEKFNDQMSVMRNAVAESETLGENDVSTND